MMAEFMRYVFFVSLLFAVGALGVEQVCAHYRWPRRYLWALALAASLAFPTSMALTTRPAVRSVNVTPVTTPWPSVPGPLSALAAQQPKEEARSSPSVAALSASSSVKPYISPVRLSSDRVLAFAWLTLSITFQSYCGFVWLRLRRTIALAPRHEIHGVRLRVTDDLGPAVFGLIRPEILVPHWILDEPTQIQLLALAHERQHIAARDPALLFGALIAVALMPWNLALWWMVRRLRFCMEADCDARVLQVTGDTRTYAEALLAICQHHALRPSGSLVLTSSTSSLERRIRLMLAGTSRISRVLAASGSAWALGLLGAAILLHAPGLAAPGDLRKLPPQDTKPGTEWVRRIARTRFPELFKPSFEGMAQLTLVLNQDGSVVKARERRYSPDQLPRFDWARISEETDLQLDQSDILYSDEVDIRPLDFEGHEPALGYIAYAVLKWPHDPMRAESRVRAAVEAYYPDLRTPAPSPDRSLCMHLIAILMNDDGSVRQARREEVGCSVGDSFSADETDRLNEFGLGQKELGRGGSFGFEAEGHFANVHYTWPRHADDPPNVAELSQGRVNVALGRQPQPRPDTQDDAAIIVRYFPDLEAHGRADLIKTIDGRRYRAIPWMLFGRDGHIWEAGRSLGVMNSDGSYSIGASLTQGIAARFPGIRVDGGEVETLRMPGALIHSFWISPASPVQRRSDVASERRKALLVNADFIQEVRFARPSTLAHQPLVLSYAYAVDFGTPAGIGFAQNILDQTGTSDSPVTTRLIATKAGPEAVDLELQTRIDVTTSLSQPPSQAWVRAATVRVPYGGSGTVNLIYTYPDPPTKVQIVLRPERLRDRPDQP
jgi:beta-lactamase regulating signal transducer with metallopeptidase domain